MLLLGFIILIAYLILIYSLSRGFNKVPETQLRDLPSQHHFSLVIPFRNETEHLPQLLESIGTLKYPTSHFEILLVNDGSTDSSEKFILEFFSKHKHLTYRLLQNNPQSSAPKKEAIELAVSKASNPWIITTDADVILPKYWLDSYDEFLQDHDAICVAGPVKIIGFSKFIHRFQSLDFMSLQGSSLGAFGLGRPMMCNAANLCYNKDVFIAIEAYKHNKQHTSGDDVFLLEAMLKENRKKVFTLKNEAAIVETTPVDSWSALINQRQRWASKTRFSANGFTQLTGILVLLMNLWLCSIPVLILTNYLSPRSALMFVLAKTSIDFLLIFKTVKWFKESALLTSFLFVSLLYPIVAVIIVAKSTLGGFSWKERTYR